MTALLPIRHKRDLEQIRRHWIDDADDDPSHPLRWRTNPNYWTHELRQDLAALINALESYLPE